MNFPEDYRYSKEHEWLKIEDGRVAKIGITDFAQSELGDIVFLEIETVGQDLSAGDVFGTVEAVKTVSDLFLPLKGKILEVNTALDNRPELLNTDPYTEGWIVKMELEDLTELENLLSAAQYKELIGQ